jgi:hypothetical protein
VRRTRTEPVELAIDALAAYRLTRLATVDTFPAAASVRERVSRWARRSGHPALDELVHCPWCIGFWISAGVVVVRAGTPRAWSPLARALAFSAAAGVIAHHLSDEVVQLKVDPEARAQVPEITDLGARTTASDGGS